MATRVAVIGGGVVGAACAYELARCGADVVLLERERLAAGASWGNTGWVTPHFSYPLATPGVVRQGLRSALDPDGALVIRPSLDPAFVRWLWRFRSRATASHFREASRALVGLNRHTYATLDRWREEGLTFEQHVAGLVLVAHEAEALSAYLELFQELRSVGHDAVSGLLPAERLVELEPALDPDAVAGGVHAEDDRFVQPAELTRALGAALRGTGATLQEGARVASLERRGGRWVLHVNGDALTADRVVVACGVGSVPLLKPLGVAVGVVGAKGYSVTAVGTGIRPRTALYLAEAKVGLSGFDDAVRIAGVFELPGRDDRPDRRRIETLVDQTVAYLRDWHPGDLDQAQVWAGLRPATADGLPLVGEVAGQPGLFLATGHGMLGVTLAPATAALLAPVVLGAAPPPELAAVAPRR